VTELGDLVHGHQWEPSAVLALCQIEERDHGRLSVIVGVFGDDSVGAFVVFVREIELGRFVVLVAFQVERLCRSHRSDRLLIQQPIRDRLCQSG
jgi:hypothetical protein